MAEEVNKTGTDLEILKKMENAWFKNNPEKKKRNTVASLKWFSRYIPRSMNNARTSQMFRDRSMWKQKIILGKLYFFEYDAIHKDTLPVWDRYPMVYFFDTYRSKKGDKIYLGINLHYLPPALRFVAMRALLKLKTENRYRKSTRLRMTWDKLKAMAASKLFEHAVHAYRADHFKSVMVEVPAQSWEMAIYLPLARWQKGGKAKAWKM